jgi:hypothetical protein
MYNENMNSVTSSLMDSCTWLQMCQLFPQAQKMYALSAHYQSAKLQMSRVDSNFLEKLHQFHKHDYTINR